MRYSIRNVPNNAIDRQIMDRLKKRGVPLRRRGRGPRPSRRYWQSLPQEMATKLTYYFGSGWKILYYEYVGLDNRTDKPRIRFID